MKEVELNIKQNGQYQNIDLKELEDGEFIVLEKDEYNEGLEKEGKYGPYYIVTALYKGEKVSFFMNQKVHTQWVDTGGLGDKVKISCKEEPKKIKSGKLLVKMLTVDYYDDGAVPSVETEAPVEEDDLLS